MTDQLRNSTDAEENPVLEIEVLEKSTGIDVLYPNSDNDEIVVLQLAKDFHEAFSKWEHNAARAESYLSSRQPSMQVNKAEITFDQKRLESYLSLRESLNNDINNDDRQSVRSKISCRSSISRHSIKSSILSVKRADAAADLAAKQIELDAFQAKAKHREETARMEAELARRKAQLEQMEIKEQIQIANARLNVYQEIDKEEQPRFVENQPVAENVDERNMNTRNSTRPISFPGPANPCLQSPHDYSSQQANYDTGRIYHDPPLPRKSLKNGEPYHKHLYQQPSNPRIISTPRSDNTAASAAAIAAAITDSISMSRLPVPEPIIFKGEPIEYSDWKFSFYALVDRKCISASDKMYYLRRYIEGHAEEAICGLFLHSSEEAYDRAWKILDERFGHPFVITKAYRSKLQQWPKINSKDYRGLQSFADFLSSIEAAMNSIQGLNILNDFTENQKLLAKLPDWLISRWNREVNTHLKETKVYPNFTTFVSFVSEEANLGCNPISSCSAVKEVEALHGIQRDNRQKDTREKTIFLSNQGTEASPNSKKTSKQQVTCTFCTKNGHQLDVCMKFLEQSTENRLSFVKENKLCFGCLKKGHVSSECLRRLVCSRCNKKHPTCLHEERDTRKEQDEPRDPHKSLTSCTLQGVSSTTTSMIFPVWLSSLRSNEEVLAYAILDTQSNATFILKEICDDLNVEMQPTKLRLSTITNQESVVDSHRITDHQVRGYTSDI